MNAEPSALAVHPGRISVGPAAHLGSFVTGSHRPQAIENEVRIWGFSTGQLVRSIATDFNGIFSLACSTKNEYLAIGGGGVVIKGKWQYTNGIEVWDLRELKQIAHIGEKLFFVKSLAFSPNGALLLSTNYTTPGSRPRPKTACVRLWRTSDFKQVAAFGESDDSVQTACFSPDGEFVVFANDCEQEVAVSVPSPFRSGSSAYSIFRAATLRNTFEGATYGASVAVPRIIVWNVKNNRQERSFGIFGGIVNKVEISRDGRLLASSGAQLTLWDFANGCKIEDLKDRSSRFDFTHSAAFSPDGKILAAGTGDQLEFGGPWENCGVKLWDVSSRTLIAHLPHQRPVYSIAFAQDGKALVAGGESELTLWRFHE